MIAQRQHSSPRILEVTVLKPEDLQFLQQKRAVPMLKKIRDSHHAFARQVASGMKVGEAAVACGISISRGSILYADPSVRDLIEHYRSMITDEWRAQQSEHQRLIALRGIMAERQIIDQLEEADEAGEKIPLKTALALAADSADRIGYGKKSTTVNLNVDFAAKLEAARRRATPVIDAKAVPRLPEEAA